MVLVIIIIILVPNLANWSPIELAMLPCHFDMASVVFENIFCFLAQDVLNSPYTFLAPDQESAFLSPRIPGSHRRDWY